MVKRVSVVVSQQGQSPITKRKLREEALHRGLVPRYLFSGIAAFGVSRNDAAEQLMKLCHERAFGLLRKEFGSTAHFWDRPKFGWGINFFWRKANIGIRLTGPLLDQVNQHEAAPRARFRMLHFFAQGCSGNARDMKIMHFPYYEIWHHPSKFLATIRAELVATGKYPSLQS